MKKRLLLSVLSVSLAGMLQPFTGKAQEFTKRQRYYSVGVSAMAANYFGDLSPATAVAGADLQQTRTNFSISASRKFFPRLSGRVSFSWSRLRGNDGSSANGSEFYTNGRLQRNLSFRNDVKELAVVGEFDLFPNYSTFFKRAQFSPYAFLGAAVFHHNPKAYYKGDLMEKGWYALQPLQTEGVKYHRMQVSVPFGMGVRYRLNNQFDLGFEVGWRTTFTDYLDDVSTNYVDKGELNQNGGKAAWILADRSIEVPELKDQTIVLTARNGEQYPAVGGVGAAGTPRGNDTYNDWYVLSGFTLTYYLSPTKTTSKFR